YVGRGFINPHRSPLDHVSRTPNLTIAPIVPRSIESVGGNALVETLNEATRQIATGYTFGNSPKGRHGFANGAALVRQYIEQVRQLEAEGHIVASVADMLVDDATTLVAALNEL